MIINNLITRRQILAIECLLELTNHSHDKPLCTEKHAEHLGVSVSYLEMMLSQLSKKGLVKGRRGFGGGYYLGKPADKIKLGTVLRSTKSKANQKRSNSLVCSFLETQMQAVDLITLGDLMAYGKIKG